MNNGNELKEVIFLLAVMVKAHIIELEENMIKRGKNGKKDKDQNPPHQNQLLNLKGIMTGIGETTDQNLIGNQIQNQILNLIENQMMGGSSLIMKRTEKN